MIWNPDYTTLVEEIGQKNPYYDRYIPPEGAYFVGRCGNYGLEAWINFICKDKKDIQFIIVGSNNNLNVDSMTLSDVKSIMEKASTNQDILMCTYFLFILEMYFNLDKIINKLNN